MPVIPLQDLATFGVGLDHPEGITVTPDGRLYVGGEAGQLYRIEDDGSPTELLTTGGFMLGLAADADGRIYACDNGHSVVWRIDLETLHRDVFAAGSEERPIRVPNWGAFDASGNYYLSDSGGWKAADGLLWCVRPGGLCEVWSEEPRNFPNGLAVDPHRPRLLVLESSPGRLVEIPIREDGTAGPLSVLCELPGTVPDGVAVQQDGSLLIACYRPDRIYRWTEAAGLEVFADDPEGTVLAAPTNLVFVGPELTEWAVPNIGRWHLTRGTGVRGTALFYPTAEQLGS
jgi:gluconolactonase